MGCILLGVSIYGICISVQSLEWIGCRPRACPASCDAVYGSCCWAGSRRKTPPLYIVPAAHCGIALPARHSEGRDSEEHQSIGRLSVIRKPAISASIPRRTVVEVGQFAGNQG